MQQTNDGIEIFFTDLSEKAQEELLGILRLDNPEEANLDVFPISYCYERAWER